MPAGSDDGGSIEAAGASGKEGSGGSSRTPPRRMGGPSHFQFELDKQLTYLDELELIGVDEARLRACGWNTDPMLDHAPG
jgi:hypothetical protein